MCVRKDAREGDAFMERLMCLSDCILQTQDTKVIKFWCDTRAKHPGLDVDIRALSQLKKNDKKVRGKNNRTGDEIDVVDENEDLSGDQKLAIGELKGMIMKKRRGYMWMT
ncbi:hypothetical protein G7Y89_g61 [Cudoniella acicularis]|uniref:Uncharacterized protein n=1 Tax=Cudoniella acicularis TaxID=354080 RepID=A0A8H4RZL0_9HELO|nr:hypothetical protein G7Y89_g61 [Cudoniella acicularis]